MNVHFDFFGPECRRSHALAFSSGNWSWPGDALSCSTHVLDLTHQPTILKANTTVVWWPEGGASLRFLHMDEGPANLQNLGLWIVSPAYSTPVVDGYDVTDAIQALNGLRKQIAFQVAGSGRIGLARLELIYGCTETPDPQ